MEKSEMGIKEAKTGYADLVVAFIIIFIFMALVVYTHDFDVFFDDKIEIEGYGDYVHENDSTVVNLQPEVITSIYAYLPEHQIQIRFIYGNFFRGIMRSSCSGKEEWVNRLAVPSNEIDLPEDEISNLKSLYSQITPGFRVVEGPDGKNYGMNNPAGCMVIQTVTEEYFLQFGSEIEEGNWRYLKVDEKPFVYIASEYLFATQVDLIDK